LWSLKDREADCSPPRLAEETVTGPVTMGQTPYGRVLEVAGVVSISENERSRWCLVSAGQVID